MNYEWNLIKERLNVAKHGVDFEEAKSVFADEFALVLFNFRHKSKGENFTRRTLLPRKRYDQNNLFKKSNKKRSQTI